MNLKDDAKRLHEVGLMVIPVSKEKKTTWYAWGDYRNGLPDEKLYKLLDSEYCTGLALVCGYASRNVEALDFDNHFKDAPLRFKEYCDMIEQINPLLFEKLVTQMSQSGGFHIFYKSMSVAGNQKLASKERVNEETGEVHPDTLIETRGEGGYILISPTNGYMLLQNDFSDIPLITADERELLISTARSFDEMPKEIEETPIFQDKAKYVDNSDSPGTWYNENHDGEVLELLYSNGWKRLYTALRDGREVTYLQRPGKAGAGISAHFNWVNNCLWVFSSSTVFDTNKTYNPFGIYAMLECHGDFKKAAKEIAQKYKLNNYTNGNGHVNNSASAVNPNGEIVNPEPETEVKTQDNRIPMTDMGNSQRFRNDWTGKVLYNHEREKWLIWSDKFWEYDLTDEIFVLAKKTVNNMWNEYYREWHKDDDMKKKFIAHIYDSQGKGKISAMTSFLATSFRDIAVVTADLDKDLYKFNLQNGTYDFSDHSFKEHNPNDKITKIVDYDYDPEATYEYWFDFLTEIFDGNQDIMDFVQRLVGLSLIGEVKEEILIFCFGTGKNGKSIFFNVMDMLCGTYAEKANMDTFLAKQTEGIPNDLAQLPGVRFLVGSEVPENRRLNEQKVKDLTGHDRISARFLHKEFFTFYPTHTLWMYGNHKPIIHGTDLGIWRRIHLIPFKYVVPEEKRVDPAILLRKFKKELSGIFNWAIEGYKEYVKIGLAVPPIIKKETAAYREEEDVIGDFISTYCDENPYNDIITSDLYKAYKHYCIESGSKMIANRTFFKKVEDRGFPKVDAGFRRFKKFKGIDILENIKVIMDKDSHNSYGQSEINF